MNPAVSTTRVLRCLLLAGFALFVTVVFSPAAIIVMNGSDAINTTSFNTGLHWTGGAAPIGVDVYQTAAFALRSPTDLTPATFAGSSLEVQSGGEFRLKTIDTITVNNLTVDNTANLDITAPSGGNDGSLAGNITLNGTSTFRSGIQGGEEADTLTITAPISGTGGFNTLGSVGTIILAATNT
ncbi:MAG TPA: hypothetical protein VH255_10720, partial [Verrucomicrobiae bacterium]|nr:hypothetical protein [Verrucomicrobiae bacterium]